MKLHKRARVIDKARLEFNQLVLELIDKHELTDGELLLIFGQAITTLANEIRFECPPKNPDKNGDEA